MRYMPSQIVMDSRRLPSKSLSWSNQRSGLWLHPSIHSSSPVQMNRLNSILLCSREIHCCMSDVGSVPPTARIELILKAMRGSESEEIPCRENNDMHVRTDTFLCCHLTMPWVGRLASVECAGRVTVRT